MAHVTNLCMKKYGNHSRHKLEFISYNFINFQQITFYYTKTLTLKVNRVKLFNKKTPWLWSASELCRPSDRRLLAK
jgi:hypothetical protein